MKYDLVFEGGGAKGMVFVGALQEFEERGHRCNRLLGTSAGAIAATLLAAGYDAQEMLAALDERQADGRPVFATFLGVPPAFSEEEVHNSVTGELLRSIDLPLVPDFIEKRLDEQLVELLMKSPRYRHFFSFVEQGGWFSAAAFIEWLKGKLDSGDYKGQPRHFSQMTLAQFHVATGVEVSLIASDTTAGRLLVLNHNTAPDCPVVWAVRMSMSIPLLWPAAVWQTAWGLYRDKDISGHAIVDGGLLSNFPIELFVSTEPHVTAVMGAQMSENVLGLLIDETLPVENAPLKPAEEKGFDFSQLQTVQRINALINTVTSAHDKMVIEAFEDLVVRLPAQNYGTTEFDMNDARREALLAAGRQAMRQFFESRSDIASFSFSTPAEAEDVGRTADRIASKLLDF